MNNNTVKKLDPQDVIKLLAALRRAVAACDPRSSGRMAASLASRIA